MNWFNQNRWLGTFLILFGIATIAAACFLLSAKAGKDDALARFQQAVIEKNRLERLDPFPNEANFRKMKLHLENYGATLNKLKEELKARVPNPPPIAPNEFQTRLRQSMLAVSDRARANRVRLPDNFALGFEEYTTALPTTTAAPLLGQELAQTEGLLNLLIDAHVDGITAFTRKPLPDERSAAAAPTPAPAASRSRGPAAAPAAELIQRGVIDISFAAAPSAFRKVLNQIVSSPQQFCVIRLLHVRNDKDKGPPREQPVAAAGSAATAGATAAPPTTTAGTPVSPATTTLAAAAGTAKAPASGGAALNFIVGNEHVQASARIELLRFTF